MKPSREDAAPPTSGDDAAGHAGGDAAVAGSDDAVASAGPVLLTGRDAVLRGEIEARARARRVPIEAVDSLDGAAIERAACVILAEPGDVLPTGAPAVLAAGRILLLPRMSRSFGLEDGLDHLQFADADEAITLVESYRRVPEAFARVAVWARLKARALRP